MSFVSVVSDAVSEAATTLQGIGSGLTAASSAAAAPTTGLVAAAQDEISTAVAGLFGDYGLEFQTLSAQAQAFHDRFVGALSASGGRYASAEAFNFQQLVTDPLMEFATDAYGAGNVLAQSPVGQAFTTATGGILNVPFSLPVWSYQTALGSVVLTMYGDTALLGLGSPNVTGGSLAVSPPLALALDALGAGYNASQALGSSSAAFSHAVATGNPIAAATAALQTPGNVMGGLLFGQTMMSGTVSLPANTGYASAVYQIPFGGLFSPTTPVVLTLYTADGTPTTFALSGTQLGGFFAGLAAEF
jgi:hypothetical protein